MGYISILLLSFFISLGFSIFIIPRILFSPIIKERVKITAGKNETPPRRGIIPLCTFRSSGISNKCFLNDINKILGIIKIENPKLIKNDNNKIEI